MKKLLSYIWQLPQNLLGFALFKYYEGKEINDKELYKRNVRCKLSNDIPGGIALGNYIILNNSNYLFHELGHTKQSQILGPLYLLIIGLPSLIHAALHSKVCKDKDYYHFYTEKWANKLMGL